jgi:hypothetical protein
MRSFLEQELVQGAGGEAKALTVSDVAAKVCSILHVDFVEWVFYEVG